MSKINIAITAPLLIDRNCKKYEYGSKSSVLRRALHKYLEEQIDQSALEASYKDHMLSDKRTYTLKKIKKANDL